MLGLYGRKAFLATEGEQVSADCRTEPQTLRDLIAIIGNVRRLRCILAACRVCLLLLDLQLPDYF